MPSKSPKSNKPPGLKLGSSFLKQVLQFILAWIGSIPMCLMHLLAIIGSVIVTKYGLRFCTMVSAIPLAASLVLTSYARNLDEVFGTFSLLYGLTCCILLICANKAIYTYFDRRIPTAVGKCHGFVVYTSIASKPEF